MKIQFKIVKFIFILLIIQLGVAVLILRTRVGNIATISFGTLVHAQEKDTTADKEMSARKVIPGESASQQIDMEILESIKKKEQEMQKREESLKKREEQLKLINSEINQRLSEIKKAQSKIEELVAVREDLVEKSIQHLVKVYSSMRPEEASSLVEKLDRDITIQILSRMKGKVAGKILARVKPSIAAEMSEEIAKRK